MADRRIRRGLAAAFVLLFAACASQQQTPREAASVAASGFPAAYYAGLLAEGQPVYTVDPAASVAVVLVRRSGSLARFGHDHVVASHDLTGSIAPDTGRADLLVSLEALVVDESALRAQAGLDTAPSPADIDGTRANMLEKVLEANRYPYALVSVAGVEVREGTQTVRASVRLHGVTREVDASVRIVRNAAELSVAGALGIDQSAFGIRPFSILGGAIAVQDRLDINFRVRATRSRGPG